MLARCARVALGGVHVISAAEVGFPFSGPFLLRAPLQWSRPVALTRPLHRGAGSVVSLRGLLPRAAPAARPPICEGRHSEDHHQFSKKKTMKTTSQNQIISSELNNRS